jgi:hypothetical protein
MWHLVFLVKNHVLFQWIQQIYYLNKKQALTWIISNFLSKDRHYNLKLKFSSLRLRCLDLLVLLFPIFLILSVTWWRNASCALNLIPTFWLKNLVIDILKVQNLPSLCNQVFTLQMVIRVYIHEVYNSLDVYRGTDINRENVIHVDRCLRCSTRSI